MSVCYAVTQPFVNHFFYVVIILLVRSQALSRKGVGSPCWFLSRLMTWAVTGRGRRGQEAAEAVQGRGGGLSRSGNEIMGGREG